MATAGARSSIDLPGVNFYSPVGVVSGLGSAARGYLAALRAAAVPVAVVPVHELFVHQSSVGSAERRQRCRYPIALVHINADSVHRFLHFHARTFARAQYKIGIWVCELPALRDEWWSELRHFDEIWVPSAVCQRAVHAMTAKPVMVMPHVVSPSEAPRPGWREKLQIDGDEFAFLYVFDASSIVARKNPHCLVDAFEAAFPDHDRVRLVLKVSNADKDPEFSGYLDALAERNARCVVLRQTMETDELAGLIRASDCYVSPHRMEGFGLTVAEAMALGVPVIATDCGGTVDFVTEEAGFPLRHCLVEVDQDHGPYAKGAIWSDPSREHLRELLRSVVANPREAEARGQRARARMLEGYSAAAVGRRIGGRLAAIAPGLTTPSGRRTTFERPLTATPVGERPLNIRAQRGRFVTVSRNFGFVIAMRVAYSKVRGKLCPALALPDAPVYNTRHREMSVLLTTSEHGAATLDAVVEILAGRGELDWEVCVCERPPVEPEMARALARLRGTQPWIRIVTADESVDDATAARWTVEQATGQFVALVAPGYSPNAGAIARLLARLNDDSGIDAAALTGADSDSGSPPSPVRWADCRLLLQRKSGYLAALPRRWPLTAPALTRDLDEAGVPTAYMAAWKSEMAD